MRISNEEKHGIELLQERANKPKNELIEILNKLETMRNTNTRTQRLESIIRQLEVWQNS